MVIVFITLFFQEWAHTHPHARARLYIVSKQYCISQRWAGSNNDHIRYSNTVLRTRPILTENLQNDCWRIRNVSYLTGCDRAQEQWLTSECCSTTRMLMGHPSKREVIWTRDTKGGLPGCLLWCTGPLFCGLNSNTDTTWCRVWS